MKTGKVLTAQLNELGLRFRFFGHKELKELGKILRPNENVMQGTFGHYQGGSGLLIATDTRLLLIDKRPMFLHIEDTQYEDVMNSDIVFKPLQATLFVRSYAKKLVFRSLSDARLSKVHNYIQGKITEIENKQMYLEYFDNGDSSSKLVENRDTQYSPHDVSDTQLVYRRHPAWTPHSPYLKLTRRPSKFHIIDHI